MTWKSLRSLFTATILSTAAAISAVTVLPVLVPPAAAQAQGNPPAADADEVLADDVLIEEVEGDAVTAEEEALIHPSRSEVGTKSAAGSTAIDSFSYEVGGVSIKVPTGCFLTHVVKGSGRKITNQITGVDCVGPTALLSRFCNTRLEFHYADTSGKTYKVKRGPLNTTCKVGTVPTFKVGKDQTLPKFGKACAQLFVNGKRRAVQCHFITK